MQHQPAEYRAGKSVSPIGAAFRASLAVELGNKTAVDVLARLRNGLSATSIQLARDPYGAGRKDFASAFIATSRLHGLTDTPEPRWPETWAPYATAALARTGWHWEYDSRYSDPRTVEDCITVVRKAMSNLHLTFDFATYSIPNEGRLAIERQNGEYYRRKPLRTITPDVKTPVAFSFNPNFRFLPRAAAAADDPFIAFFRSLPGKKNVKSVVISDVAFYPTDDAGRTTTLVFGGGVIGPAKDGTWVVEIDAQDSPVLNHLLAELTDLSKATHPDGPFENSPKPEITGVYEVGANESVPRFPKAEGPPLSL